MATKSAQTLRGKIFVYAAMSLMAIVFLFPLVFMFVSSLKPRCPGCNGGDGLWCSPL